MMEYLHINKKKGKVMYSVMSTSYKRIINMTEENKKTIIRWYLVIYCMVIVLYLATNGPMAWGEPDDYILPIGSLLNDHNFSITPDDVDYCYKLIPDLRETIETCYSLSGYTTRAGDAELTWYFPTYAILNIPFVVLFDLLGINTKHAFPMTNIALMMILLYIIYKYLKVSESKKLAVILLFSINPIVFYFPWTSAETVIFVFIGLSMVAWYNEWPKRAAILLAIAGTLNATALATGFFMIADYIVKLFVHRTAYDNNKSFLKWFVWKMICYGIFFVPGIIPMLYNYYHVGAINLTASYSSFTTGRESTLQRFRSYFIDLNYGFIPYYGFILLLGAFLLLFAIQKKHWRYMEQVGGFLLTVLCYSIMTHINCGGSGIGRYNSWGAVILFTAVIFYYNELVSHYVLKRICIVICTVHIIVNLIILNGYGIYGASKTWGYGWMPISKYVMDNAPEIYDPLGSSFCSHLYNQIGCYDYETPLVYIDGNGNVRKILATEKDVCWLEDTYSGKSDTDQNWFEKKLSELSERETYISVPLKYTVFSSAKYELGERISFLSINNTSEKYVKSGMSDPEEWGSWTDSDEVILDMKINDNQNDILLCKVECGTYENAQRVSVYVNDNLVFNDVVIGNNGFEFKFCNTPDEITEFKISLPDAAICSDGRTIALSISSMTITCQ